MSCRSIGLTPDSFFQWSLHQIEGLRNQNPAMSPTHSWDADVWPSLPRVLPASLTPRLNRHHQEQSCKERGQREGGDKSRGFKRRRKSKIIAIILQTTGAEHTKQNKRQGVEEGRTKELVLPWLRLCSSSGVLGR